MRHAFAEKDNALEAMRQKCETDIDSKMQHRCSTKENSDLVPFISAISKFNYTIGDEYLINFKKTDAYEYAVYRCDA